MFLNDSLEEKINQTEKKIKELELQTEALSRQVNSYYQDLNLTPEQVSHFYNNPNNFTPEAWEELQKYRQELEQKLQTKLNAIRDPRQVKKNQASRKIPSYALFVR